jgi:hypothetical protein
LLRVLHVENFEITSGDSDDTITTGDGTDVVHAGAGSDTVNLAGGADEAIYTMAANTGASDVYQGGAGIDTLTLEFTEDEWLNGQFVQADIANYRAFQAANTGESGEADSAVFQFTAFDLNASQFEGLMIRVGGTIITSDQLLTNLTPEALAEINTTQLAKIAPLVFQVMSPTEFLDILTSLSSDALGGLTAAQIEALPDDALSLLSPEAAQKLLSSLDPLTLAAMSPEQIAAMPDDILSSMTPDSATKLLSSLSEAALTAFPSVPISVRHSTG